MNEQKTNSNQQWTCTPYILAPIDRNQICLLRLQKIKVDPIRKQFSCTRRTRWIAKSIILDEPLHNFTTSNEDIILAQNIIW